METREHGGDRSTEGYVDEFNSEIAQTLGMEKIKDIKPVIFDSMEDMAEAFTTYNTERYERGEIDQRPPNPPTYLKGWVPPGSRNKEVWVVRNGAVDENGHVISREGFMSTIRHEITHVYTNTLNEHKKYNEKTPIWFLEGFCMNIADQKRGPSDKTITEDVLRGLENTFDKNKFEIGYTVVTRLIEKYGYKRALDLIKIDKKDGFYEEIFKMFPEIERGK